MKHLKYFLIFIVLTNALETNDVLVLTPLLNNESFQKEVYESKEFWFIEFFKDVSSDLTSSLAKKLALYGIKTARVDCAEKMNKKLCQSAQSMPSFRVYYEPPEMNPYTNKLFRKNEIYDGPLDSRSLERFVSGPFANLVHKISSEEDLQALSSNSSGRVVVLFSDKDIVPMLYKSVAFSCQSQTSPTVFAQAQQDKTLQQRMGVSAVPALALALSNGTVISYSGNLKDREAMVSWCREAVSQNAVNESANTGGSSTDIPDNVKVAQRTKTFMDNLQKNIYATSPASFLTDVIDKTVLSWVVLVHEVRPNASGAEEKALSAALATMSKRGEGAIAPALLLCTNNDVSTDSLEHVPLSELGPALCLQNTSELSPPYLLVVPHGAPARKKMQKTMPKWTFNLTDVETAIKRAGEALPDSKATHISEPNLRDFINIGVSRNIMSVVLLTDKDSGIIPVMLRNLGLVVGTSSGAEEEESEVENGLALGLAQVAVLSRPSKGLLQASGTSLTLPALVAFFLGGEADAEEGEGRKNIQMAVYDTYRGGPLRLSSARDFIVQTYVSGAKLPLPERMQPASAKKKVEKPPVTEKTEEVVESEPMDADFLEEIRREEEERAALRRRELEEEARARAEAERLLKEEKAKDKKKKLKTKKKKKKTTDSKNAEL